jgi:hypothetical protein
MTTNLASAEWRKSTYSGSNGGNCVEVAANLPGVIAIRDSKDPHGSTLVCTRQDWRAFISGAKAGQFDL